MVNVRYENMERNKGFPSTPGGIQADKMKMKYYTG
jgi:hypothetical protein